MERFEVGDVVHWVNNSHVEDLGPGPFVAVGTDGLIVFDNLDGSPLRYPDTRGHYYMPSNSIRRDEFLTAVRRAKLSSKVVVDGG